MELAHFLAHRLQCHGLHAPFPNVESLIRHFGCMQSQDEWQAYWCLRSRLDDGTLADIERVFEEKKIVRTWTMRGTLHYVAPEYVRFFLEHCASRTLSGFKKRREFLGITDAMAEQSLRTFARELSGGKRLTRSEITQALKEDGIPMQTQWTYHLACYAATLWLICFAPPKGNEDAFVLLDEWIPKTTPYSKEAAFETIVTLYLQSHGFATADDIAWWAGCMKTDVKKAISSLQAKIGTERIHDREYLYLKNGASPMPQTSFRLLGGFDEYFLGYQDRKALTGEHERDSLFSINGIFYPLVMQDGKLIGTWKREFKKSTVVFRIKLLLKGAVIPTEALEQECERYAKFWGKEGWEVVLSNP